MTNTIVVKEEGQSRLSGSYSCGLLCDLIHAESANVIAEYGSDFYAGMPCVTLNRFGEGEAWYVASSPEASFLQDLLGQLCEDKGILPLVSAPEGIETTVRVKDGERFLFLLNHGAEPAVVRFDTDGRDLLSGAELRGSAEVPGRGVMIVAARD